MAHPASAVGLAAAIVQLVEFSWNLLSTAHTVYTSKSGLTAEHEDLNGIADNLIKLDNDLTAVAGLGEIPDSLRVLASHCKEIAEELRQILYTLRVKYPHKKWQSFVQAIRSVYMKDQVESLAQRLDRLKSEMQLQISLVLFAETSSISKLLSALLLENKRLAISDAWQLEGQMKGVHEAIAEVRLEIQDSKNAVTEALWNIQSLDAKNLPILPKASNRMQELSTKLSSLAVDVNVTASNHKLLSSLWFPILGERKANVATAHERTFSWLFNPDSPSQFEPWLREQNGIFWIMGKPGSGKSTLMKFLLNHSKTKQLLKLWAGRQQLVVTSFFLWRAGAALQKSQEGLYRSLLFEILHQCPDMIQSVCASKAKAFRPYDNSFTAWTLSELSQALNEVQSQSGTRARFCFFIDGLDEYDGDSDQMVEILESLAKWNMVKICASSRPWNEFIDAFGRPETPQLALEALTQHDIKSYVQDRLEQSTRFKDMLSRDDRCQELMLDLVHKARGVFLWVELVVKSLLTGLRNADRISDLQRRLRDFPPTLEEYFSKILISIEPIYRQQTAETFEFALKAKEPLSLTTYSFLDEDSPDQGSFLETASFTDLELLERHDTMRRRLNGRSKGLLEVASGTEIESRSISDLISHPKVDFLHRTAHDFLLTRDLQLMLKNGVRSDFNPSLCLVRSFCLQALKVPKSARDSLKDIFQNLTYYASELEQGSSYEYISLLDQVLSLITPMAFFLTYCVQGRLYRYITQVMDRRGLVSQSAKDQLLAFSLGLQPLHFDPDTLLDSRMVSILVKHGASPRAKSGTSTIWEYFLIFLYRHSIPILNKEVPAILTILLSGGADLKAQVLVGQQTAPPKLPGRGTDRRKRSAVRTNHKLAEQIIREVLGEERAQSILREGQCEPQALGEGVTA